MFLQARGHVVNSSCEKLANKSVDFCRAHQTGVSAANTLISNAISHIARTEMSSPKNVDFPEVRALDSANAEALRANASELMAYIKVSETRRGGKRPAEAW